MEDTQKMLSDFWRKFGMLISSGVSMLSAFDVIKEETTDQKFKALMEKMKTAIKAGKRLAESLEVFPEYFPPSIQTMAKAGEVKGVLDEICLKIAEGIENGSLKVGEKGVLEKGKLPKKGHKRTKEEEFPVVKLANSIIHDAIKKRASDIHIEWLRDGMRIRYRIDGVLKEINQPPKKLQEALISQIKIMANMDVAEKKLPQDGRIQIKADGKDIDCRVSSVPCATGESVVIRILVKGSIASALDFKRQGFSKKEIDTLKKWSRRPNGIIIVTGPTGCGKTTTIYTLIKELNREGVKVMSIEDPVEYQMDGVNQMQVNYRLGLTFPRAIRAQLRQDPDIIMVGEIRDMEMAQAVIAMALTGHLVITALHTQDASGALRRLLDVGLEPYLVNSSVIGIVAQRLVRTICPGCKKEHKPETWIRELLKDYKGMKLYKGKGCKKCSNSGYRGRIAIHELLEMDEKMRYLLAQEADLEQLRKQAIESGMLTLREDGIEKVRQGITTIEEVLRVTPR